MSPFHGGGDMIETVSTSGSTFAKGSRKFEAGTQPLAEAIGLASAIDFIEAIGFDRIAEHDRRLTTEAIRRLKRVPGLKLFGPADTDQSSSSIISLEALIVPCHL
jgi:cysteine desulfurase/selenocysteine lyase